MRHVSRISQRREDHDRRDGDRKGGATGEYPTERFDIRSGVRVQGDGYLVVELLDLSPSMQSATIKNQNQNQGALWAKQELKGIISNENFRRFTHLTLRELLLHPDGHLPVVKQALQIVLERAGLLR